MQQSSFDLAGLLRPLPQQAFLDEYWEKKPLHVQRGAAGYYDSIAALHDLESQIASPHARHPAVQLSKNGHYFPAEVYTDDVRVGTENFAGVIDVSKVAAEYRAGATVVLPAVQRTWAPLLALCARLECELGHRVHANAYLTPGNAAGFSPHYDTHDVFVLQIAGRKLWRIYEPPLQLPHRKQPFTPLGYQLPAAPLLQIELAAGDLLYLPRGFVHTTNTAAAHSAHVTIGIDVYTWLDLAGEALQQAMASVRFRKALPPGFAAQPQLAALRAEFEHVLADLRDFAQGAPLIDSFLSRLRPMHGAEPAFHAAASVIDGNTWLRAPSPPEFRLVQFGEKLAVEHQARRFIVQAEALPALQAMQRLDKFRAIDLPGALPPEAKLTLLRLLHDRGFLAYA